MRTSRREQAHWIARHEASGQSLRSFCRQHDIPYQRMHYWAAQHRKRTQASVVDGRSGFVELMDKPLAVDGPLSSIEVFIGAARLLLPRTTDPKFLAALLREVSL